jgi:enoyl-CoA hydratase
MTPDPASTAPRGEFRSEDATGVRLLTIDSPETRNALSLRMLRALPELLSGVQQDEEIRAVIIRGAGECGFCSGFDLGDLHSGTSSQEAGAVLRAALDSVTTCDLPVIASIDGWCIGAGLELALSCDLRVCSSRSFFRLPAAQLGISYPEHGLARFAAVLGRAVATRVALLGERLEAAEAERIGLVHVVAADAAQAAMAWADRLAEFDRVAVANMKRTIGAL